MSRPKETIVSICLPLLMSCVGVGLGVWLFRAGFVFMGSVEIGVWLLGAHRFAILLLVPQTTSAVRSQATPILEKILLAILCLLAAGVCAFGAYWWYLSPEDWQAGLVFILFGLIVLIPVTIREVQFRLKVRTSW